MFVLVLFLSTPFVFSDAQVQLQKVGQRTEAVLDVPKPEKKLESKKGIFKQTILLPEKGIVGTARLSSSAVGKLADASVEVVQRMGQVVFAPILRAIDIRSRMQVTSS